MNKSFSQEVFMGPSTDTGTPLFCEETTSKLLLSDIIWDNEDAVKTVHAFFGDTEGMLATSATFYIYV